jgi:hypothetical protein
MVSDASIAASLRPIHSGAGQPAAGAPLASIAGVYYRSAGRGSVSQHPEAPLATTRAGIDRRLTTSKRAH